MMAYNPRGSGLFPEPTWWNGPPEDDGIPEDLDDDVICPDCRGERRAPDGGLCKRCGGTAQIRRSELEPGEEAPFEDCR